MIQIDKHKANEAERLEVERAKMQADATAKAEREAAEEFARANISKLVRCPSCNGAGFYGHDHYDTCTSCNGNQRVAIKEVIYDQQG